MKTCTGCRKIKPLDSYHRKKESKDGRDYYCKECKAASKAEYLIRNGGKMNETRFKSIFNNLSSIAKKVYEVIPDSECWSSNRVVNELYRYGIKQDLRTIDGVMNSLLKHGLLSESSGNVFSKVKVTKNVVKQIEEAKQENEDMAAKESNPFDGLREIAIKFFDMAKTMNGLATEIDKKLSDIERKISDNEKDTEKLKQLQSILKSIG